MAMAIFSCSKHYYISSTLFTNLKLSRSSSSSHTCSSTSQYVPFSIPNLDHLKPELGREHIHEPVDVSGRGDDSWSSGVLRRRRKRRKRRRSRVEECDEEEYVDLAAFRLQREPDESESEPDLWNFEEGARLSGYVKEKAKIVAVRKKLLAETNEQDLDLSRWAEAAKMSRQKLDRILCNGRLSEERILRRYKSLVWSIAWSDRGKGISLDDLAQVGNIGLLRSTIPYNPQKGVKLSTYAYWWIKNDIVRTIENRSKLIRLPTSITQKMPKICEAINVLSTRLKRLPSYDEIAEATELKMSVVKIALDSRRPPVSLHKRTAGMSVQEIIQGPIELTPEAMLKKDLLKAEVEKLLESLTVRQANVLRWHYGFNGGTRRSFESIGQQLNLTRERVRQIHSEALSKLRKIRGIDSLEYFILEPSD